MRLTWQHLNELVKSNTPQNCSIYQLLLQTKQKVAVITVIIAF